jgi:hypothetical protein
VRTERYPKMGEYTKVLHEACRKEQDEKAAKRKAGSEFMPQPPLSLPPHHLFSYLEKQAFRSNE